MKFPSFVIHMIAVWHANTVLRPVSQSLVGREIEMSAMLQMREFPKLLLIGLAQKGTILCLRRVK